MQKNDWYSKFSFHVFIPLTFLSLLFCPASAWAEQSDVGSVIIDGERTIAMGWMKMGGTSNPAAGWPEVENLETAIFDECAEYGFGFVMQYGPWYEGPGPTWLNDDDVLTWMDYAESKDVRSTPL